jgi:hypothetical protein
MVMLFRRAAEWDARAIAAQEEIRQSIRSTHLAVATLACRRCDAPIAIGDGRLRLTQTLSCPYCRHQAPVRDFLSLAQPTRPMRVIVRVSVQARAAAGS